MSSKLSIPPHLADKAEDLRERAEQALVLRGAGFSCRQAAARTGLDLETVRVLSRANRELVGDLKETIRLRVQETLNDDLDLLVAALSDDVQNPESRTKPQSFRVLCEAGGVVGAGTRVHVGDINVSAIHVGDHVQQLLANNPEELKRRLREEREALGL